MMPGTLPFFVFPNFFELMHLPFSSSHPSERSQQTCLPLGVPQQYCEDEHDEQSLLPELATTACTRNIAKNNKKNLIVVFLFKKLEF